MRTLLALMFLAIALPAAGQTGEPPLPRPKPAEVTSEPDVTLPRERPERPTTAPVSPPSDTPHETNVQGPPEIAEEKAPSPPEPPRVYQTACPAVLLGRIEAKLLPPIEDGLCGARSPLALTGVLANGRMVPVSGDVETDCGVASALPEWIESVDSYLLAREHTRIAELIVGTSYMCRRVNGASSGNLSFHGLADALDVVGFRLEDGRVVSVETGWNDATSPEGRLLRFAHGAACAHFTTVLGPEANAEHHDHLHVDLGCHGKTCTARICE